MTGSRFRSARANPRQPNPPNAAGSVRPSARFRKPGRRPGRQAAQRIFRRHPFASLLGGLALAVLAALGYVYWTMPAHFETTDDAFIAARQFSIAPKVLGLHHRRARSPTTSMSTPASVIAQIDERDYRNALAQADAQVRVGAGQHREHRCADRRAAGADHAPARRRSTRRRRRWCSPQQQAPRYQAAGADRLRGTVQNAQQYTSQLRQQQAALASAQANVAGGAAADRGR